MAGREPPHMGPMAHGFAALGEAAERAAVSGVLHQRVLESIRRFRGTATAEKEELNQ
jgi:hypothetical protein